MNSRFDQIMHSVGLPALFAAFGEPASLLRLIGTVTVVQVMLRQRFTPEEIEGLHIGIGDGIAEFRCSDVSEEDPLVRGDVVKIGSVEWTVQRPLDNDGLTISYLVRRT